MRAYIRAVNLPALRSAARYAWRAETIYDIHAPLAFAFAGQVLEDRRHFYHYDAIDALRAQYAANAAKVQLHDAGAGSQVGHSPLRSIRAIAASSATPPRFGRYLTNLVDWRGARTVLELGTNLGIGSCYLAAGMAPGGRLVTIDADAGLAAYAKTAIAKVLPFADARVEIGTFADRLPSVLAELGEVDVVFVDGHHAEAPTEDYYEQLFAHCHEGSVLIFDDIHWSLGMENAWAWIRSRPEVTLSIDLYRWGVVFFEPGVQVPQHLTLAPRAWKPWHMGFFSAAA